MIFLLHFLETPVLTALKNVDRWLFIHINSVWTNAFLDGFLPFYREAYIWGPLYLFLVAFIFQNFGGKAWTWIVFFLLCFAMTDQISAHFFKYWVNRPRPCQDPVLMPYVRELLGRCPGNPGFPSSHATNHFGLGIYLYLTLKPHLKKWSGLFIFWAASISYAQVYVGVHYPSDILGGAVMGSLIGWLTAYVYITYIGLPVRKQSLMTT